MKREANTNQAVEERDRRDKERAKEDASTNPLQVRPNGRRFNNSTIKLPP